jgi:pimeloyl-ACP methyl ester carboxylesterase
MRWGFDAGGAAALYHSYRRACYWSALERPPPGVTLHVVRGARSDRWTPEMLARLEAARAAWQAAEVREGDGVGRLRLHVLPDAGHWLQVGGGGARQQRQR